MDFATMVQGVLVDTRDVSANADEIKLAIIDSCVHHQRFRFWFNEVDFTLVTKTDTDLYPLSGSTPDDLMYIEGKMWIDIDGDTDNRHEVVRKSPSFLENLRSHQAYTSWPEYFAVKGTNLLIYPSSDDDDNILRWRGHKKIRAPRKRYDTATSTWKFPDGDNFTNEFFSPEVERSVREYANYLRLAGPLADEQRAGTRLQFHLEARSALIEETEGRLMSSYADPWPESMSD